MTHSSALCCRQHHQACVQHHKVHLGALPDNGGELHQLDERHVQGVHRHLYGASSRALHADTWGQKGTRALKNVNHIKRMSIIYKWSLRLLPGQRPVQREHPRLLSESHEAEHLQAGQHGPAQRRRVGLRLHDGPQETRRLSDGEPGLHGLQRQHVQVHTGYHCIYKMYKWVK